MSQDIHLSKRMSLKISKERNRNSSIPYTSTAGSIMYAMLCTRPDVAYAFSIVSRFQADPREAKEECPISQSQVCCDGTFLYNFPTHEMIFII